MRRLLFLISVPVILASLVATLVVLKSGRITTVMHIPLRDGRSISAQEAGIRETMERCNRIMSTLQANGWKAYQVPADLMHFPDQIYGEDKFFHASNAPGVVFPIMEHPDSQVAFFSPIYVHTNQTLLAIGEPGQKPTTVQGTVEPSGFFIVGYRDGSVKQIALSEVRMRQDAKDPDVRTYVFPGTSAYDSRLPKIAAVELAAKGPQVVSVPR